MWAIFHAREPATRFSITREEEEAYFGRAQGLLTKGLGNSIEVIWNSILPEDRSFMVAIYLSRPANRKLFVHEIPTFKQAEHAIRSDRCLYPNEKAIAIQYLPDLTDKYEKAFFRVNGM
jgi:hypothetical protein